MTEEKKSESTCSDYGKGWDEEACVDCLADWPEEYEECKRLCTQPEETEVEEKKAKRKKAEPKPKEFEKPQMEKKNRSSQAYVIGNIIYTSKKKTWTRKDAAAALRAEFPEAKKPTIQVTLTHVFNTLRAVDYLRDNPRMKGEYFVTKYMETEE